MDGGTDGWLCAARPQHGEVEGCRLHEVPEVGDAGSDPALGARAGGGRPGRSALCLSCFYRFYLLCVSAA